jgi:hypothetical protein
MHARIPKSGSSKSEKSKSRAPVLPRISEEMKQWSAMLGVELSDWPQVSTKPMFGMTAYYRGEQIFAVLPKTRAFETSKGIAFRFEQISDKLAAELRSDVRVITNPIGKKWITFEVDNAKDVNAALEWLARAYENSRKVGGAKSIKKRRTKSKAVK